MEEVTQGSYSDNADVCSRKGMDSSGTSSDQNKVEESNCRTFLELSAGCGKLQFVDMAESFAAITPDSRKLILQLCGEQVEEDARLAIPAFRRLQRSNNKLDFSYRVITESLLLDAVEVDGCNFAYARFPPVLYKPETIDRLLKQANLSSLELGGASISLKALNQLLRICPYLEQLSLEGLHLTEEVFMLEPLENVRVLNLAGCSGLGSVNIISVILKAMPNIKNISVANSDMSGSSVIEFCKLANKELEVVSFAELGWRFDVLHLAELGRHCTEIKVLNVSSTRAAHFLDFAHYVPFAKLEELSANMSPGIVSVITAETLLNFQLLPNLKSIFIHRRITVTELNRLPHLNLPFMVTRYLQQSSQKSAANSCRSAVQESGEYPVHQLPHRTFYGGSDPL